MKKIKIITILLFFSGLMVLYNGCKEDECPCTDPTDPACENYDPCYGKREINTFFKVRPGDRGFPPPEEWCDLIPCDTFNASSVRFDIPHGNPENSTYEWQIGTEAEPRKGKAFEIDFSDYIQSKGYADLWIPITLTIRTPMNSCLQSEEETLKTVTRKLFYTKKQLTLSNQNDTILKLRGHFTFDPNNLVELHYITLKQGEFRGIKAPITLLVGLPNFDTSAVTNCNIEGCNNYKHSIFKIQKPENCTPNNVFLTRLETIFLDGSKKIKRIWEFTPPTGMTRYVFIGERIK